MSYTLDKLGMKRSKVVRRTDFAPTLMHLHCSEFHQVLRNEDLTRIMLFDFCDIARVVVIGTRLNVCHDDLKLGSGSIITVQNVQHGSSLGLAILDRGKWIGTVSGEDASLVRATMFALAPAHRHHFLLGIAMGTLLREKLIA